jgi:hypothetical protein
VLVDLRNVYRAEEMARHGFDHHRIGARARRSGSTPTPDGPQAEDAAG